MVICHQDILNCSKHRHFSQQFRLSDCQQQIGYGQIINRLEFHLFTVFKVTTIMETKNKNKPKALAEMKFLLQK